MLIVMCWCRYETPEDAGLVLLAVLLWTTQHVCLSNKLWRNQGDSYGGARSRGRHCSQTSRHLPPRQLFTRARYHHRLWTWQAGCEFLPFPPSLLSVFRCVTVTFGLVEPCFFRIVFSKLCYLSLNGDIFMARWISCSCDGSFLFVAPCPACPRV